MKKLILLIAVLILAPTAFAQQTTVWDYVDERLEKKKFDRWSLTSWFYNKEEMRLQDQWLSMNTDNSGLFTEFYIDYAQSKFDSDTSNNDNDLQDGYSGEFGAYLTFLGVTGRTEEYDSVYKQTEYSISLRLIGSSVQSTHLALHYGSRNFEGSADEEFKQSFYGGDMALYLTSFLGFDARYRVYGEEESSNGSYMMASKRTQWGMFIDIWAFRLFAYQFEEDLEFTAVQGGAKTDIQIKGTAAGLRVFF